jgi:6-pyruvoyltetrahydropterin/6-carboxytetrahydropterin synthase
MTFVSDATFEADETANGVAMIVWKEFGFEAAHFLPNVAPDHKCRRLHGHSYSVRIEVEGDLSPEEGWVIDFGDLKTAVQPLIDRLDHRYLNDIEGLENPTTELLAKWIWTELFPAVPQLARVMVSETSTSGVMFDGRKIP